jgi:hypothetical protein
MVISQVFFDTALLAFMMIFFLSSLSSFAYVLYQRGTLLPSRHGPGLLLKPLATLPWPEWSPPYPPSRVRRLDVSLPMSSLPPPRELLSLALYPYTTSSQLPPRWTVPSPLVAFDKNDNVLKFAAVALSNYIIAPLANLVLGGAWLLMRMCFQVVYYLIFFAWAFMYMCLLLVNFLLVAAWVLMHMAYPICFHLVNFVAICLWLLLGMLSWATKSFCFVCVADPWFCLWTGDDSQVDKISRNGINYEMLNLCLFCHTAFQTLPSLLLYLINGSLLQQWSPVAVAGLFFTVSVRLCTWLC